MTRPKITFQARLTGFNTKPGKKSGDAPEATIKLSGSLDEATAAKMYALQINPLVTVQLQTVQDRFDGPAAEPPPADPEVGD